VEYTSAIVPPSCHAVSFFQDEPQLCAEIASFVAEGLKLGEPALIVTNEPHRRGIAQQLSLRAVDVERAVADGDLLMVDADETLSALMGDGDLPNAAIYHREVGAACRSLLRGRPGPIRIFGDMVDMLWQRGEQEAAIRIEILSNQLAVLQPISVICGYSMGHFLKSAAKLDVVRQLHGRIHEPGVAVELLKHAKER
jgi:DcmR-like sensory protein